MSTVAPEVGIDNGIAYGPRQKEFIYSPARYPLMYGSLRAVKTYALGLGARICYFQHGKLTLDDAGEIATKRKHPLFGVRIFEAGKVPLEVELGKGEGLDAHRRRLIPQTIRVQAQRSAGPYGLGAGAPQGPRMKPGAGAVGPARRRVDVI